MRHRANAGQWLRRFINMADDKDNIFDKIVMSVYNIHHQFVMKDSSLSRSVGIFYLGVYCSVELCRVTQKLKQKKPQLTDRDSCALHNDLKSDNSS